jgi:CubicO group peptidase (beta-lactamase class C family)
VADVRTGEPVTTQTVFGIGSLTKPMVATVIARLAEAGVLALDDSVAAHVPELRGSGWARGSTVRDLLANRSGLPLRSALEFGLAERSDPSDDALARLATDVDATAPASGFWSYTNVGWCLLGRVIETAAGAGWEDAMRAHLADIGLGETTFASEAPRARRVAGHQMTASGAVPVDPLVSRAYGPAGANTTSTVADLLRFAALHLRDPSLAALRAVHADVAIHGWLDSWCLGWARFECEGGPMWGWDGLLNGERSVLRLLPQRQAAAVLLTNGSSGRAMYRSLFTDLMGSQFGIDVAPLRLEASAGAAGDLSRFAGVYAWPDRRVAVAAAGDHLLITGDRGEASALPVDDRTFLVDARDPDNATVTFGGFDADGRPSVLYLMLWGLPRIRDTTFSHRKIA